METYLVFVYKSLLPIGVHIMNFHPNQFFDLSQFSHAAIFNNIDQVWKTLSQIGPYLAQIQLGQIDGDISPQAYLIDPHLITIGKGTIVEPGAYIKGPCIIGENCQVRHGAYLRGNIITGNNCVLGHASEFKNVLILNDAHAAHFAYVGDSILGNHVNLGAGTRLANLKLDRSQVTIKHNNQKIPSGLKKFGAILADHVQTGCNSVLNPGTLMGKAALCYPCINFGGVVQDKQIIR